MDWSERIGWLLLGCFIGFVLGYIVRTLREIKEELDEVDEIVLDVQRCLDADDPPVQPPPPHTKSRPSKHKRDEKGAFRMPVFARFRRWARFPDEDNDRFRNMAIFVAVLLTVWAAFASQRASNAVQDAQDRQAETQAQLVDTQAKLARVGFCTQSYLSKVIVTLNERTTFTTDQAISNVRLQQSQAEFFELILTDPQPPEAVRREAAQRYFTALSNFVRVNTKSISTVKSNPFPRNAELENCLTLVQAPPLSKEKR